MYIQITTRCNMKCPHCCFSCSHKGEDMALSMFKTIVDRWGKKMQRERNRIVIGGGEPTIHPKFWEMVNYAMKYGFPLVVTNGSLTDVSLKICSLAKEGKMWGILSLDKWHSPISEDVIDAFKEGLIHDGKNRLVSIDKGKDRRSVVLDHKVKKVGRGKDIDDSIEGCCCPILQIAPNGIITGCGCQDAPIVGTVQNGFLSHFKNIIPSFKNPPEYRICSKFWKY